MPDRRMKIIAELEKNLEEIIGRYQSLSPADLATMVYTDGAGWTVQQVLAHFITIEQSMHRLFQNILDGGPGSPEDFDIDRFNKTQPAKLDGLKLEELTARFRSVRQETIAMVRAMDDADLERPGRHAFHGQGTLEHFIVWTYEHVRLHIVDLHSALVVRPPLQGGF